VTQVILVTGATGKTGRRLVPRLVRRGAAVRAASRSGGLASPAVDPVVFDWSDRGTYEDALRGADAIYVVPADPGQSGDPAQQVQELLERGGGSGVQRVVLLSALGVDNAPQDNPMRRVELAVEASRIPATILRPGAFMQNFAERFRTRILESIRERDEIFMPGGEGTASWISAEDIAEAAAVALTQGGHEGKGYTLVGPQALTMSEISVIVSAAAGRPIAYAKPVATMCESSSWRPACPPISPSLSAKCSRSPSPAARSGS
jgi:uncharacterized protein YbjT (DUF2867 family)